MQKSRRNSYKLCLWSWFSAKPVFEGDVGTLVSPKRPLAGLSVLLRRLVIPESLLARLPKLLWAAATALFKIGEGYEQKKKRKKKPANGPNTLPVLEYTVRSGMRITMANREKRKPLARTLLSVDS